MKLINYWRSRSSSVERLFFQNFSNLFLASFSLVERSFTDSSFVVVAVVELNPSFATPDTCSESRGGAEAIKSGSGIESCRAAPDVGRFLEFRFPSVSVWLPPDVPG